MFLPVEKNQMTQDGAARECETKDMENQDDEIDKYSLIKENAAPPGKVPGGWKSIRFILANEAFEKLASMSLIANIALYLRSMYNIEGLFLVNVINIFSGSSNITPIAGAIVSDAFLGRFLTLLFGSISSFLGMVMITLTAGIQDLRPPPCQAELKSECQHPHTWQLLFLFASLGMLVIGAGGIRPCNIAFGADQFDTSTAKGKQQLESFFNWWYFSFTIALIIALTVVVYIQTNISWVLGFAVPSACLFVSIAVFLIGHKTYICKKPQGSVFSDMVKVINAAIKKRALRIELGPDGQPHFYDPPATAAAATARLSHTDRFTFLDKAAIITAPMKELNEDGKPRNEWRLCSLQQVEQLKCLITILPVWLTGIVCFMTMEQQTTFGILQAFQMDRKIGRSFEIPPGWMGLTSMIALSIWVCVYECVYLKYFSTKEKRLTMEVRIQIGIWLAIACMAVSGIVERCRRQDAVRNGSFVSSMSVLWLLPQFGLAGLVEAFTAVAIMELLTMQMPESMRTVAGAVFFLSLSISSYFNSVIVNVIHSISEKFGRVWIGGRDLNQNVLENYYWVIMGLGFINIIYFNSFAKRFIVIESRS